jgi:hypothetical protein
MKPSHLLSALALTLTLSLPALAHGNAWETERQPQWQQTPVRFETGQGRFNRSRGQGHQRQRQAQMRFMPIMQPVVAQACAPTRVVSRSVPVYVPIRQVVVQPQAPQRRVAGTSVTFRWNL